MHAYDLGFARPVCCYDNSCVEHQAHNSESEPMSGPEGSEEVSGNSDDSMQESGSEEEEEDEEEEEEVLEPKVLPQRGTRGNRMNTLIAEEDSADEEFWQQDFFAEEGRDEEYKKSSEGEDEADTDFSESESESDDEEQDTKEVRVTRHKPLKPPGTKKAPNTRARQPLSDEAKALQAEQKADRLAQLAVPGEAPTLRHSTRIRVEEAQQVRQRAEKVKPKRIRPVIEQRPLTQDELLAEAARTELDNLRDLEQMVALEEATRKKAMYKRSKYSGPMIRFHSKKVQNVGLTMVEVVNMLPPPYMLPQKAPKPAAPLCCAITGKPAKYRDPVGGYGYADLEAYKELKQRMQNERRGHTGKRTKRQSSKGLNTLTPMHQQDAESDPAQLATAAAQDHTAVPPQSLDAADLLPKQAQSAADAKDADLPGTAAAEEAACTVVTPLPAVSPQAAPAVAPATADVAQAQAVSTGVQIHVAPGAAGTTAGMAETLGPAPMAQQDSQQAHGLTPATDRLSAAAVGPDHVVTDASDTLDAGMPLLPAVSKPVVSPSGLGMAATGPGTTESTQAASDSAVPMES